MILITGGAFQGKKAYAMEHFHLREQDMVNGADCGETDLLQAKAVTDFQEYVRRVLKEGGDASTLAETLYTENPGYPCDYERAGKRRDSCGSL